jgi:hypothetical protein
MIKIEIFENFKNFLGYVEDFIELKFERCYRNIGNFKMELNNFKYLDILKIDNQILINKTDLFIIKRIEQYKNVNGELIMNIEGTDASCFLLDRVMNTGYSVSKGQYYMNIINQIINKNIRKDAGINRDMGIFSNVSANQGEGSLTSYMFNIYNLKEAITRLCSYANFGYRITFNPDLDSEQLKISLYKGKDKTKTIFFSEEYGNIENEEFKIDTFDIKNVAYVVKDETRDLVDEIIDLENKIGIERKEIKIDSAEERTATLNNLKKSTDNKITANLDILSNEQFKYRRDFDVGDTVTYESKTFNFTTTNTIMKVTEIYKNNNQFLEIDFGSKEAEFGD